MVNKPINRIVVLMYHSFDSGDEPSEFIKKGDLVYVVGIEDFKKQMAYLAGEKVPVVTLQDCYTKEGLAGSNHDVSIILTFDDGDMTNYAKAFPILKQHGFKAYFFITTDCIGQSHYMTEDMIREVHNTGMVIGSHGKTHSFLPDLTDKELDLEMKASRIRLEEIIRDEVTCFSVPGGRINDRIVCSAKEAGYSYILGSAPIINRGIYPGRTIGRFAIMRGQAFSDYVRIISGEQQVLKLLKYKTLSKAKEVFGNRRYLRIRDVIMGEKL